jgi:hypothetical protein
VVRTIPTGVAAKMMRSRGLRQWGGHLALVGLWLQLVLSFGHFHPEDFAGLVSATATVVAAPQRDAPPQPADEQAAHEACAICANLALAGALVLPASAKPSPPPSAAPPLDRGDAYVLTAPPFLLFLTRAPPSA